MRLLLAAAAITLAAPLPAAAQSWFLAARGEGSRWYVDADSIKQDGQWTRARQVTIYDKPGDNGEKSTSTIVDSDCKGQTQRFVSFAMFDSDREQLGALDWPDKGEIHPLPPGSIFEIVFNFICNTDRRPATKVDDPYTDTK